jgi:hypothetical protein
MKKDIPFLPVQDVLLTIVKTNEDSWQAYLINRNEQPLENVMITSKGYGINGGEEQRTSVLRHMIPLIEPRSFGLIEPIDASVFHLTNEYWVSFFIGSQIYDKKYLFVPDTITENNLIFIEELNMKGVLHP